ncbi:MAG: hypothetical protein AAF703_02435 [Cyanobacteria bacterium P01_D01_bin.105]
MSVFIKLIKNVCASKSGLLLAALMLVLSAQGVSAQRPGVETNFASLFSRSCVKAPGRNSRVDTNHIEEVSVGRRFKRSVARIDPGSETNPFLMTCNVNLQDSPSPFGILTLDVGHEDSSGDVSTLNIYLDGNLSGSFTIREGDVRKILVDIADVQDVAIEAAGDRYLYVFDATLHPLN